MSDAVGATCECSHLTDERMGYPPDAKAAREHRGPHHTPIRCVMYAKKMEETPGAAPSSTGVYAIVGDRL